MIVFFFSFLFNFHWNCIKICKTFNTSNNFSYKNSKWKIITLNGLQWNYGTTIKLSFFCPAGCILPFDSPTDCNNCWMIKTFVQLQNMRQNIPIIYRNKEIICWGIIAGLLTFSLLILKMSFWSRYYMQLLRFFLRNNGESTGNHISSVTYTFERYWVSSKVVKCLFIFFFLWRSDGGWMESW